MGPLSLLGVCWTRSILRPSVSATTADIDIPKLEKATKTPKVISPIAGSLVFRQEKSFVDGSGDLGRDCSVMRVVIMKRTK